MSVNDQDDDRTKLALVKIKDHSVFSELGLKMSREKDNWNKDFLRVWWEVVIEDVVIPHQRLISKMKDWRGETVVHYATIFNAPQTRLFKILEMFPPQLIAVPDNSGCCALHYACRDHPKAVIFKMMRLCPKALEVRNEWGLHPLHHALMFKQSESVILKMIQLYPKAIEVPINSIGLSPKNYAVHLALVNDHSDAVIMKIIDVFSNVITEVDEYVLLRLAEFARGFARSETICSRLDQMTIRRTQLLEEKSSRKRQR